MLLWVPSLPVCLVYARLCHWSTLHQKDEIAEWPQVSRSFKSPTSQVRRQALTKSVVCICICKYMYACIDTYIYVLIYQYIYVLQYINIYIYILYKLAHDFGKSSHLHLVCTLRGWECTLTEMNFESRHLTVGLSTD